MERIENRIDPLDTRGFNRSKKVRCGGGLRGKSVSILLRLTRGLDFHSFDFHEDLVLVWGGKSVAMKDSGRETEQ